MLQAIFHAWERRLASVTTDRIVRPFEWGLEWIPRNGTGASHHAPGATPAQAHADASAGPSFRPGEPEKPAEVIPDWVSHVMADTDASYTPPPTRDYNLSGPSAEGDRLLTFPSALETPHRENNTVYCRLFPGRNRDSAAIAARAGSGRTRAAVIVLPQWNADPGGHVGL